MTARDFDALLVDWGGVLTSPILESFAAFVMKHELDPEVLPKLFKEAYGPGGDPDNPVRAIETGRITEDEFSRHLAAVLSEGRETPLEHAVIREGLFGTIRPDEEMMEAVRAVRRAGLKTGLISNTWGASGFTDRIDDLFDDMVTSGEAGIRKPDPGIFRLAAERLGVPPERCVFVDDIQSNVEGARSVGMVAIHHRTAADTIPELERLLGVDLSPGSRAAGQGGSPAAG